MEVWRRVATAKEGKNRWFDLMLWAACYLDHRLRVWGFCFLTVQNESEKTICSAKISFAFFR